MKNILTGIAATLAMALAAPMASAGFIDPYLDPNGKTTIEDDSGEAVLRFDEEANEGQGGYVAATGDIMVGDILIGFLDYSIINTASGDTNIDSLGLELTSIFIVEVDSVTDAGTACTSSLATGTCSSGNGFDYAAVDLVFSSVDPALWSLVGIDLAAIETDKGLAAGDLDGTIQVFYDDDKNNLDVFTDTFDEAVANTLDGNLRFILGDTDPLDGAGAEDSPKEIATFLESSLDGGVSKLGNFDYQSTFLWDNLAGTQSRISASGFNLANDTANFGVQDDTQATWISVPTPGTVLLLGAGLLGLGFGNRRKVA